MTSIARNGISTLIAPTYEASAQVRVSQEQGVATLLQAIDTRPVAEDATQRLSFEMSPEQLLANLTIEHVEGTNVIRLTYEHTNPVVATDVVNTFGKVASERISETSRAVGSNLKATMFVKASVVDNPTPVSPKPLRNGLLALVIGLALSASLIAGRELLRPS